MVDHNEIYRTKGQKYQKMISFEDVDNNLRPAMEKIIPLSGKRILDLGSGTGRIPYLFQDASVVALDLNWSMLLEQIDLREKAQKNWGIVQGDMRFPPFPENSFDVITAGWAISNFPGKYAAAWEYETTKVLEAMQRLVKDNGALIIIETMTTGSLVPAPPFERLAVYYEWLEKDWGFTNQVIQTDYQFNSLQEAVDLAGFFFGEELSIKIKQNNWVRLPEWTGVWGKIL